MLYVRDVSSYLQPSTDVDGNHGHRFVFNIGRTTKLPRKIVEILYAKLSAFLGIFMRFLVRFAVLYTDVEAFFNQLLLAMEIVT